MSVTELDARTIDDMVRYLAYGPDAVSSIRHYANGRVETSIGAREAYSYGRHFPLFRFVPRKLRVRVGDDWTSYDRRAPDWFVINGDIWRQTGPSRTGAHQESARQSIARTGLASIVLPFSALDGAGIDIDSIRPLHVRPDERFTETLERRTLAELPRHRRTYSEPIDYRVRSLAGMPNVPRTYREATADETRAHGWTGWGSYPPARDADGWYSYRAWIEKDVQPDDDGIYRWDEERHRLGDSLFTAERTITERRAAGPFESESASRRETVTLASSAGRRYCTANDGAVSGHNGHVCGPDGACIHCNDPLTVTATYRRRARYLSSFDYQESPALYFLCEVPRHGVPTVDGAIDSLAPRAVHAARLAGKEVRRQGDVFFIDTPLSRETLAERGATFGRLTQWTRDAAPRAGEVTYRAPNRERDTAIAARELRYARRRFRESFGEMVGRAMVAHVPDADRRETSRAQWRAMLERHTAERTAAGAIPLDDPLSQRCPGCGANVGVECLAIPDSAGPPLAGRRCNAIADGRRCGLARDHERERSNLRHETRANRPVPPMPHSKDGARRQWAKRRAERARAIESARVALRRATLAGASPRGYSSGGRMHSESHGQYRRRLHVQAIRSARENLARAYASGNDRSDHTCNAHARDEYRARYGNVANALWARARDEAQRKYRPETVADMDRARRNRETVRRHLMVYGTAHSATEVARVGDAVYVRGTVSHAVGLETGGRTAPDHRPIVLTADRWYLAVRNAVPRQNRRRRRRGHRTVSGNS